MKIKPYVKFWQEEIKLFGGLTNDYKIGYNAAIRQAREKIEAAPPKNQNCDR